MEEFHCDNNKKCCAQLFADCYNNKQHYEICCKELSQETKKEIEVDITSEIIIGVHFNICVQYPNTNRIINNIKFTINKLNEDFNNNPTNKNTYIQQYYESLTEEKKKTFDDYISKASSANIKFVASSYRYKVLNTKNIINENNFNYINVNNFLRKNSPPMTNRLNIWVVEMRSILGYASFPWLKADARHLDGVVLSRYVFGNPAINPYVYKSYNLSKTLTHEVGHWLGLLHTFQGLRISIDKVFNLEKAEIDYDKTTDDDTTYDCIVDTPIQKNPSFGVINNNNWNNNIENTYPMFMNYMDYSDDICLFMFTEDQVKKMRLFINQYRKDAINKVNAKYNFVTGKLESAKRNILPETRSFYIKTYNAGRHTTSGSMKILQDFIIFQKGARGIYELNQKIDSPINRFKISAPEIKSKDGYIGYFSPKTKKWKVSYFNGKTTEIMVNDDIQNIGNNKFKIMIGTKGAPISIKYFTIHIL